MAVFNEVQLTQVELFNRMDSEFYKREYMRDTELISAKQVTRLMHLANITDGIHDSPHISDDGIQYISAKCVKDNEFVTDACIKISTIQNEKNPRTQLNKGDVIITSVGTIGNVAVVEDDLMPSNCDRHVGIIRVKENVNISPYYLSTFLNSKYGRFQTLREAAGNVQLNLYVHNIGLLLIPRLGEFETKIALQTYEAYRLREKAKMLYSQAQELLEQELGVADLVLDRPKSYEANFSEIVENNRLDAEFFSPDLKLLLAYIEPFSKPLGKIFSITRGRCADTNDYNSEKGIPFIRIKELSYYKPLFLNDSVKIPANKIKADFPRVTTNDYVIAVIGATIGKINLIDKTLEGAIFSNNTAKLSFNGINTFPYALELILRSKVIQMQIQQRMAKTAQEKIVDNELIRILIPILNDEKMEELNSLVLKSKVNLAESVQLLEESKRSVEELIEGGTGN